MSGLLIVSLAPSLDRYAWLSTMALGTVNRPREVVTRAGGKGLNAARAARGLGLRARIVALVGGVSGHAVREKAREFDVRWLESGAETRQCLCLLDDAGVLTEVYEPVPPVSPEVWPAIVDAVAEEIPRAGLVALSGQVPPGLPVTALAEFTGIARRAGVPVIVDAAGPALAEAVAAHPALLKVNEAEAATVDLAGQAAVVTAGGSGATWFSGTGESLAVSHDPIPGALPVGSGDAFLAGLATDWLGRGRFDPATALPFAAAAARANARKLTAGDIDIAELGPELRSIAIGHSPRA
jgi:fructose-1-phosphate kinase PfkB-like protein